jgi:curli biogenesis system outer membrane secretion channel CsgG
MKALLVLAVAAFSAFGASAAPRGPMWLVLDKITYASNVNTEVFDGIDKLLLTKLVQAKKYKCLDRDMYDTAAREEGFGGKVELIPAGYAISGEVVQLLKSGKSASVGTVAALEYVATVSLRVNDLKTLQPYEAETLRVSAYCQTPKDMLVHVVKRVALAILMRDHPMRIRAIDEDDEELTVDYGADFISVGEQFEVRRVKSIDSDDGEEATQIEKVIGLCEIVSVGKTTSQAKLVSGKAKVGNVLRFSDSSDRGAVPPLASGAAVASASRASVPHKKPRIAVAPFITKSGTVSVWGTTIAAREWLDVVVDHLSMQLVNTGSFKTLDRSFGSEIDRELNRIVSDANASIADICRLSNKLASDYLVVAEVTMSDVASAGTDFATGLPLPPPSAQFAEVRMRCIHAPTTEIVASDVVRVDSQNFYGTKEVFISSSAEWTAANLAAIIQSKIDPDGFARRQAELRAGAAQMPLMQPQPQAPAQSQGIKLGF